MPKLDKKKEVRSSLAPTKLSNDNPAYKSVEELDYAISLPECRNIALTGIYGSGKSSVIDTYLALDKAPKKVLRVSLSNFEDSNTPKGNEYENEIEFKLFQHIIYKANPSKTQSSRYKRLQVADVKSFRDIAILISVFLICYIIVFEPSVFRIEAFYDVYRFIFRSWSIIVNTLFDVLASIIMAGIAFLVIKQIVSRFNNLSISSLKAKEIEINFKDEKSVFNQLLDEILYYFKSGEYELIIFEDLDRISEPQKLFLKLREINILLNESDYYISRRKNIKFLYAIKDDVFKKEVRTKCFDYIIPVIPVVNSFNAGEYLLTNYTQELEGVNSVDVKRLGMYISSMRELTNIMNEFMIYKKTIFRDPMSAKKLLAITIYKNLFPDDYSKIHTKEGCLYNAFKNKRVFSDPLTRVLKEDIENCKEITKQRHKAIAKCRMTILDWFSNNHGISQLVINGTAYTLDSIANSDSLFDRFKNDRIESWIIDAGPDSESGHYDYKYKVILSSVDPGNSIEDEITGYEYEIKKTVDKRRSLEKQVYTIESKTLYDLMKQSGDGTVSKTLLMEAVEGSCNDESLVNTLHALILSRYIADDYTTYISYTYTGSFGQQEFKFQQSVIQGIPLDYNYKLEHIDAFIDNLYSDNYESKCILNNDLLSYLLITNKPACLDTFILTARKYPDFVVQYDSSRGYNEKFMTHLFKGWDGCVKFIFDIQDNDVRTYMLHLFYRFAPINLHITTEELELISTQYKFIADDFENCSIKRLNEFFDYNLVIFKELVEPDNVTRQLFDSVVSRKQFVIDYNNLRQIYGADFETKSFTCIIEGKEDLRGYVLHDIVELLKLFPSTDTDESEEAIVRMSNNKHISDVDFESFIARQDYVLQDIKKINADRIPLFFKHDKVTATWENVKVYFSSSDQLDHIKTFVIKHVDELKDKQINEGKDKPLQLLLIDGNQPLPIDVFEALLPSCGYYYNASEIASLQEDRLRIILEQDFIEYDRASKELYNSKSNDLWGHYLVHFFDEFKKDESFDLIIPNETAIYVLNSTLTIEQKKYFIDNMSSPLNETGLGELSSLICFYYQHMDIDDATSVSTLIKALDMSDDRTTWKHKIDLINRINRVIPYNESTEVALLHSLGGEYLTLSSYRGVSHFDNNSENRDLLNYLHSKGHYINKIKEEDGGLKVTFKNPPSED